MADRSAAVLVEVVLSDDSAEWLPLLTEELMVDPPLVVWAVCQVGRRDEFRPRSASEVARWLGEHALEVLEWDTKRDGPFDASEEPRAEQYADLAEARLAVADMAALLAASDGQSATEQAYLAGLLHDPGQWVTISAGDSSRAVEDYLPEWLRGVGQTPAAPRVVESLEVLAGKARGASPDLDPEACRRRAGAGRRSWLEVVSGPGRRLPALIARLARLRQLEDRFHETLEAEKLAAMAELAAGAGHEINNPLAIIGGRTQLFLQEETDPERRRELALMNAQVRRAHEMIADMRLFARPPRPEPETIDLVELVDSMIAALAPQAAGRATSLGRTGEDGPLEIEADPAQLQVALRAMCRNSLEAIGHGGHIEVSLARSGGDVQIRVSDDGPGILPEHRRHLFDPFYSARQAGRGLGLGLSKCWRIVTNHGGRIEVASEPGRGAAFTITLPLRWSGPRE